MIRTLSRFTGAMTEIVEKGIQSGEFSSPWPAESVELLFWMLEITLGISPEAKNQLYRLAGLPMK